MPGTVCALIMDQQVSKQAMKRALVILFLISLIIRVLLNNRIRIDHNLRNWKDQLERLGRLELQELLVHQDREDCLETCMELMEAIVLVHNANQQLVVVVAHIEQLLLLATVSPHFHMA